MSLLSRINLSALTELRFARLDAAGSSDRSTAANWCVSTALVHIRHNEVWSTDPTKGRELQDSWIAPAWPLTAATGSKAVASDG
jgi:hypothetical protein